jgi:hypothetical protein
LSPLTGIKRVRFGADAPKVAAATEAWRQTGTARDTCTVHLAGGGLAPWCGAIGCARCGSDPSVLWFRVDVEFAHDVDDLRVYVAVGVGLVAC